MQHMVISIAATTTLRPTRGQRSLLLYPSLESHDEACVEAVERTKLECPKVAMHSSGCCMPFERYDGGGRGDGREAREQEARLCIERLKQLPLENVNVMRRDDVEDIDILLVVALRLQGSTGV